LPAGNHAETLAAARRESLTGGELRGVVELLLASGTREKRQYVLEKPRQALREVEGHLSRSWDPRMSAAGNHISRRLARLLELLGSLQAWLRYSGRGTLELRDRQPLRPGFERLLSESRGVAELTVDFLEELHLP
jgi:hypothetical protein